MQSQQTHPGKLNHRPKRRAEWESKACRLITITSTRTINACYKRRMNNLKSGQHYNGRYIAGNILAIAWLSGFSACGGVLAAPAQPEKTSTAVPHLSAGALIMQEMGKEIADLSHAHPTDATSEVDSASGTVVGIRIGKAVVMATELYGSNQCTAITAQDADGTTTFTLQGNGKVSSFRQIVNGSKVVSNVLEQGEEFVSLNGGKSTENHTEAESTLSQNLAAGQAVITEIEQSIQ